MLIKNTFYSAGHISNEEHEIHGFLVVERHLNFIFEHHESFMHLITKSEGYKINA